MPSSLSEPGPAAGGCRVVIVRQQEPARMHPAAALAFTSPTSSLLAGLGLFLAPQDAGPELRAAANASLARRRHRQGGVR